MGIDLNFWKYKENTIFDAQDVYKKLSPKVKGGL